MSDTTQLINDYLDLKDHAAKLADEIKSLEGQILDAISGTGKHEIAPGIGITITKPRSVFQPEIAAKILTSEQVAACSETKISSSKAKQVLAPALYAACTTADGSRGVRVLS